MRFVSSFLVQVATLVAIAIAGESIDPIKAFCSRWYHQSQVKNGFLYIDGGLETFADRNGTYNINGAPDIVGNITTGQNNYIIAVDMSTSWNWKTNISETLINSTIDTATDNSVPIVQSAALFHGLANDSKIYLYGGVTPSLNTSFPGWQGPTVGEYTLWGFDVADESWSQYDVYLDVPERPSFGAYAEVEELGLAFYLNGQITNYSTFDDSIHMGSGTIYLHGLIVLDLNNQTATNVSTSSINDGDPQVRGSMAYIPGYGQNGVLVTIGGATGSDSGLRMNTLDSVDIFDVAFVYGNSSAPSDDGWYTQSTSGDIPAARVDFCTVVAAAPDSSSYNIYLYGGWDPTENTFFDDIYVLTLPGFTWLQMYSGSSPRFGHTCHVVGNRQMITVGGLTNNNDSTATCDWEYESVAIYDLTVGSSIGWGSVFNADAAPYEVNAAIVEVVGGNSSGGATVQSPSEGWSSTSTAMLFTGTTNQTAPVSLSSTNSTSSSTSAESGSSSSSGSLSGGDIAGIAVGSVAGLTILAVGLYFCLRKKKPQAISQSEPEPGPEASPPYDKMVAAPLAEAPGSEPQQQVYHEAGGDQRYEIFGVTAYGGPPAELPDTEIAERSTTGA